MSLISDIELLKSGWVDAKMGGLDDVKWSQIVSYGKSLHRWSSKVNLISPSERDHLATKHIWRGLCMVPVVKRLRPKTIVDVGSGSGIIGVPIKICLPELRVFFVESRRKRANFLKHIVRETSMKGAEVIEERVENWSSNVKSGLFTARSVASPAQLQKWVSAHAEPGAILLCTLKETDKGNDERLRETISVQWMNQSMRIGVFSAHEVNDPE